MDDSFVLGLDWDFCSLFMEVKLIIKVLVVFFSVDFKKLLDFNYDKEL